ncbi:hypothetical protein POTOM_037030 [Populus tomentosa]|uniref:Uncharacterized protein n=1 Tax=Populus tomentosa TaxID=118781 RepID=A0A8X8CNN1_POPTO|nr:hypothetical protein POTOM_037030 [Populus tomentosa]
MHQDFNFQTRCLTQSPHATAAATRWTREEDKIFEQALTIFPENLPDRWQSIANHIRKPAWEVKEHYDILVHDVLAIDSGRVELPTYRDDESVSWESSGGDGGMVAAGAPPSGQICFGGKAKQDTERKKGTPWTEDEHNCYGNLRSRVVDREFCIELAVGNATRPLLGYKREKPQRALFRARVNGEGLDERMLLFLVGLNKFGKGDWRSISRNVVITRTPTQVASHAQKYFLRQNSVKKERKRSSIHDITSVDNNTVGPSADDYWNSPPGPPTNQDGPPGLGYQNFRFQM